MFLGEVDRSIVSVKNESFPATLLAEWNQCCKKIIILVLKIKHSPLWKGFNSAKSQWTPNKHHSHFLALNRMSRSFGRLVFSLNQYLDILSGKIESGLITGDNEVRTFISDGVWCAQ
jgi:hypothetical protein